MKYLTFAPDYERSDSRTIRAARFEERSLFPISAACLVANAVREALGALYGTPLQVRLFEPAIPSPDAWRAIVCDALIYRLHGIANDAMIAIRRSDAVALAAHAFGESDGGVRTLSAMERQVFDRAVAAIALGCASACGAGAEARPQAVASAAGFVTYFELQIERPLRARVGIGLIRDSQPEARGALRLDDLLDVRIEVALRVQSASMNACDIALLEPGAVVPMTEERAVRGTVLLAGTAVAVGECGVRDGRYAITIEAIRNEERGSGTAA
ncbi:MAG: FliM/FliN family flagellar motor switch protein [Candidatus Eremiobacteraeota bacterium]|nr:FliM/FliN family flagellar motor switch protein [Candidatus Eremiobacteraeota bacterium]